MLKRTLWKTWIILQIQMKIFRKWKVHLIVSSQMQDQWLSLRLIWQTKDHFKGNKCFLKMDGINCMVKSNFKCFLEWEFNQFLLLKEELLTFQKKFLIRMEKFQNTIKMGEKDLLDGWVGVALFFNGTQRIKLVLVTIPFCTIN